MGLSVPGSQGDGIAVMIDGLEVLAQGGELVAEIVLAERGGFRAEVKQGPKLPNCPVRFAPLGQCIAQLQPRPGVAGLNRDGSSVLFEGFVVPAEAGRVEPRLVVGLAVRWIRGCGALGRPIRLVELARPAQHLRQVSECRGFGDRIATGLDLLPHGRHRFVLPGASRMHNVEPGHGVEQE